MTDERAAWSTAYINDLPDSAFADPSGRRYPHHDASGAVDRSHLANAMARCNQDATSCSPAIRAHLAAHERALGMGEKSAEPVAEIRHGPREDLYRAMPGGVLSEDGRTLTVRLAPHDQWAEITSAVEGHFLERFSRSAYRRTMANSKPKILFEHGKSPLVGESPIATTDDVGEDATSPYARGTLLDGVPDLIVDGIRKNVYGASHRFSVVQETWDDHPIGGAHNPNKLPERTITEARLYELGPVTWPAYAGASVALRSLTDEYRPIPEPVAPSDEPAVDPHPVDEARDEPDPPPDAAVIAAQDPPEGGSPDTGSKRMEYITRDEKASRVKELEQSIASRAVAYPGRLPEPEAAKDKADKEERETLLADIAAWDERQAYIRSFAGAQEHTDDPPPPPSRDWQTPTDRQVIIQQDPWDYERVENGSNTVERRLQMHRDNAMRITERMSFPHPDTDTQATRDRIALLLDTYDSPDKEFARRVSVTTSPLYRRAFAKMVKGQQLSPEEQRGTALAVGVDGTGGFAIPVIFDLSVIAIGVHTGAINPYRRVCRVVPIVGTDTWNALTATAVVATRTTEAAPAIEQGPTFAQPQYIVKRVQAQITYSLEVAQDRTDIESAMAVLIQEAKDNEEESQFAIGVGTTVFPLGVGPVSGTSGAYTSLNTASGLVIVEGDLTATEAALPVRHRFNAQWFMNRVNIRKAQSLETTGGKLFGGSIYFPSVGQVDQDATGNTGLRLLGYPVNESPSLPTSTATTITAGVLLNPDTYVIVDRIGMQLQIIPFVFGASQGNLVTGQQALYAMWRNDARPLNNDGGRLLRFL